MTTLIFVENVLGSGRVVKLTEDFGDYTVSRELLPGENARVAVSPFKVVSLEEAPTRAVSTGSEACGTPPLRPPAYRRAP